MRGAGTGRVRRAKEAFWCGAGVLGAPSAPTIPFGLGLARSRREGDSPAVRPHWSLLVWGPGPAAQQPLTGVPRLPCT